MVLMVRNKNNDTLIDIEVFQRTEYNNKELVCYVSLSLRTYDETVTNYNGEELADFRSHTYFFDEDLREQILLRYNYDKYEDAITKIKSLCDIYAGKFGLFIVED